MTAKLAGCRLVRCPQACQMNTRHVGGDQADRSPTESGSSAGDCSSDRGMKTTGDILWLTMAGGAPRCVSLAVLARHPEHVIGAAIVDVPAGNEQQSPTGGSMYFNAGARRLARPASRQAQP